MSSRVDWGAALPRMFTVWCVVLVALHRWTHATVDLLLLTTVTAFVGVCVFARLPAVSTGETTAEVVVVRGWPLLATDLLFHIAPLVFVASRYGVYYRRRGYGVHTLAALLLLVGYTSVFPPIAVYGASVMRVACISMAALAVHAAFLKMT
jgi:hypothetical protein